MGLIRSTENGREIGHCCLIFRQYILLLIVFGFAKLTVSEKNISEDFEFFYNNLGEENKTGPYYKSNTDMVIYSYQKNFER